MIKAICFDLDGVYFTPESFKNFKAQISTLAKHPELVEHVFHKSQEISDFKRGKISEDSFWNYAISAMGLAITKDKTLEIMGDSYEVNQDVVDTVKKVRAIGYKTCVCSNNFTSRINVLDKKFGFQDNFDAAVFSFQTGFLKPEKEIYQILLDKLQIKADELIYSDDSEDKLTGAKELGINTFVFTTFTDFVNHLKMLGVKLNV